MEAIAVLPPPLPPKSRKSPPASSTTVLSDNGAQEITDVFSYRFSDANDSKQQSHVVKIQINPQELPRGANITCEPYIRISVTSDPSDMVRTNTMVDSISDSNNYFYYDQYNCGIMSSGQISPSDTLDSGTCSDLDGTPPPLPKKKGTGVSVTIIGEQPKTKRPSSLTSSGAEIDSDDTESNLSCDSLNSGKISTLNIGNINGSSVVSLVKTDQSVALPQTLLQDIRQRNAKLNSSESIPVPKSLLIVDEKSYPERQAEEKIAANVDLNKFHYDTDMFYDFHLNEHEIDEAVVPVKRVDVDETFAGFKDFSIEDGASTICSAKGTVRGVKNRVRAGIATFLQINSSIKNYKEKDAGKVVLYSTTMGILRETYQACMKVKQILRTLLVKFEERDVFMSSEYQAEIRERMRCDHILVPQVFVDGQHVGDAETIERLNETGELRRILKPFKSLDACTPCQICGGYRLLPCTVCKGSKKSVHRNHFTAEFVALKCMNCDEVGLIRCNAC